MRSLDDQIIDFLSDPKDFLRDISYYYDLGTDREWRVNFGGMQRMVLANLQAKLISLVPKIESNGGQVTEKIMADMEPVLARYSKSIRFWTAI
jgi:hypothetical protein